MRKLICILAILAVTVIPVFGETPLATMNIPIRHVIRGDKMNHDANFTFKLKADESAPMPEGSENGVKTVTVKKGQKVDFGDIAYYKPDVYYYTITRNPTKVKGLKSDTRKYSVCIVVTNDGGTSIVMKSIGADGKSAEVMYSDTFKSDKKRKRVPDTGDSRKMTLAVVGLASAGLLIIALRRREKNRYYCL